MRKMHKVKIDNIAVLTSEKSWFVPYACQFVEDLRQKGYQSQLFHKHEDVGKAFEVVFMLSYFRITDVQFLKSHKHNLVVHESDLPRGKGWAPLFWQILEGKSEIPIVLFEAHPDVDGGDIYIKSCISLEGHELHDEIRKLQAEKTIELCLQFLESYEYLEPVKQKGTSTYYKRRTPEDSKLDLDKTLKEQLNLSRIVNNKEFPAFFNYQGYKYIIQISKEKGCK